MRDAAAKGHTDRHGIGPQEAKPSLKVGMSSQASRFGSLAAAQEGDRRKQVSGGCALQRRMQSLRNRKGMPAPVRKKQQICSRTIEQEQLVFLASNSPRGTVYDGTQTFSMYTGTSVSVESASVLAPNRSHPRT
jgi:hypothetical protein